MQEAATWLFPKNDEAPLLEKMMGMFRKKDSKDKGTPSLEANSMQTVADLQKARAMQAR